MKQKVKIPKEYLQPGTTLADRRYRIDSLMEANGLTVTYKGFDTFRKKTVVIRELFPEEIMQRDADHDDKVECRQLSEEALFLSMKDHMIKRAKKLIARYPFRGVANIMTYLEERDTVYVIEEYVKGRSLAEYLQKRHSAKFLPEDLMRYLSPVMDTLQNLHDIGIFHGSICPEQILLRENGETVLTGVVNPMEDVAEPQLGKPAVRKDAYAPVELYLPEAERGAATDVYEIAAVLYRYVTGVPLPAYYERINQENSTASPDAMLTRVMQFQSEAIMKGVAVYAFDRFASVRDLQKALCPDDVDFDSLREETVSAGQFAKKPFWYRYNQKIKRQYQIAIAVLLLVGVFWLGPKLADVARDVQINRFYEKFNAASLYEQCEMVTGLSRRERERYTNDYMDLDASLTDEEKAELLVPKYYDFQLKKYVTQKQFNTDREYYEYMQIDVRTDEIWINYRNEEMVMHRTILKKQREDGSYEVRTEIVKKDGSSSQKTEYAKP